MNRDTVMDWLDENEGNFSVFRLEREPYQLFMDVKVSDWIDSDYSDLLLPYVVQAIVAFCAHHNMATPKDYV